MKVCYVYHSPISEEKKDFSTLVPRRMARILGGEIELCVLYSGSLNTKRLSDDNISAFSFGSKLNKVPFLGYIYLFYKILVLAKEEDIDLFVNVWAHYLILPSIFAARIFNKKFLARVVGAPIRRVVENEPFYKKVLRSIGLAVEKMSLNLADGVHLVSESLREEYSKRGVDPDKMSVISLGVDTRVFKPLEKLENNRKKLIFVGRLVKNKRVSDLIRILKLVREEMDVELVVIGEGPEKEKLKDFTRKIGFDDVVRFPGYVEHEELPSLYNSSSLLVLPSKSEGLPNVVLEAQSCGLPFLARDIQPLQILAKEGGGKAISFNNYEEVAAEIVDILSDEGRLKEMGKKGRKYINENHSLEQAKEEYMELFYSLKGEKF